MNSTLTSGQAAKGILKRLLGVSVDQNDNILFQGGLLGVNIMIYRKKTCLSGNQLANYLKGLNAKNISKIEPITAPPSEINAAGNTGIINIIPKKKIKQGYAIDLRFGIRKAKYRMVNENISASMTTRKINVFGSPDFNTPHGYYQSQSGNSVAGATDTYLLRRINPVGK